jgi:hypothetical protein
MEKCDLLLQRHEGHGISRFVFRPWLAHHTHAEAGAVGHDDDDDDDDERDHLSCGRDQASHHRVGDAFAFVELAGERINSKERSAESTV